MKRLLLFLLASSWSFAATYTIAPSGGDYTSFAALVAAKTLGPDDLVIFQASTPGGSATFDERLVPNGSGTSGHPIIITKRVGDTVIVRGINGGTRNYIYLIGLQFTQASSSYNYSAVLLSGCTGWLIQDCYFYQTYRVAIDIHFGTTNTYCIIRNNVFSGIGFYTGYTDGANNIECYGNNNLIEYNTFGLGLDRVYAVSSNSLVRNNYDTGMTAEQSHGVHVDEVQGGLSGAYVSSHLFVSNNFWKSSRGSDNHSVIFQDASGSGTMTGIVIRQNITSTMGSGFSQAWQGAVKARYYNNTIAYTLIDVAGAFNSTVTFASPASDDIKMINNSFYATDINPAQNVLSSSNTTNFSADYNAVYANGVLTGFGTHNVTTDPLFTDPTNANYLIPSNSPLRSASTSLTTASGDGTASTSLTVVDATGICDGFGIADGDWIKIGSGAYVKVSAVNYGTNAVTLSDARTWSDGDAVIVKGMEDIGALPYDYVSAPTVTNTTSTASPTTLSATSASTESVRMVQFLIDGIPVGIAYYDGTGTYSLSYTPSGARTLEARAYNYWASETLTVSSWLLINQDPSSLSATAISFSQINLSWTDNSGGTDSFSVERSLNGTTGWSVIASPSAGVVAYSDTGLSAGVTYYYRVRAVKNGIYSGYTSNANATTNSTYPEAKTGIFPSRTLTGLL